MAKSRSRKSKAETDPGPLYAVGEWKGKAQYRCLSCAYDTLHEADIQAHVATHLPPAPKPKPSPILVCDRYGNPVNTAANEEVADDGQSNADQDAG